MNFFAALSLPSDWQFDAAFDAPVAQWFHAHAIPQLTPLVMAFTDLHHPASLLAVSALIGCRLAYRRDWFWLWRLAAIVPSAMLLNVLLKHLFQRGRPVIDDPLVVLSSYSFPSGHVAGATVFYGVVTAMWLTRVQDRRWRACLVLAATLMVLLVALSRLYLSVHYLSDVVAGLAEGLVWLALCLTASNRLRPR